MLLPEPAAVTVHRVHCGRLMVATVTLGGSQSQNESIRFPGGSQRGYGRSHPLAMSKVWDTESAPCSHRALELTERDEMVEDQSLGRCERYGPYALLAGHHSHCVPISHLTRLVVHAQAHGFTAAKPVVLNSSHTALQTEAPHAA